MGLTEEKREERGGLKRRWGEVKPSLVVES